MDPNTLAAVLQAAGQQDTVRQAEAQLGVLSQQPGFGPLLTRFALDAGVPVHIRQLASVLLRQYVRTHWDANDESFTAPEMSEADKTAIKSVLPQGLADPNSKKWPGLIEELTRALGSTDMNLVRGSIRCLEMFAAGDNFTDQHLPLLVQFVLPTLLQVFSNTERFNERIRMRAVGILFACVEWLGTLKGQLKKQVNALIETSLVPWFPFFAQALQAPDRIDSDCGLKLNIVQCVTLMLAAFPARVIPHLASLLPPIYTSLVTLLPLYDRAVVRTDEARAAQDSDGDVLGLEALVLTLLEFVNTVIYGSKSRALFPIAQLPAFLSLLIGYLQLTAQQVEQWADDPEQFLKDETDQQSASTSPRKVVLDVLELMQAKFGDAFLPAATQAIMAKLQESAQMKASNDAFWWRLREAAHTFLGAIATELTAETFNLDAFLPLLAEDAASSLPCLRATALWCSSQFSSTMIDGRFAPFVQHAIETIQLSSKQELPVRIFACRALTSFLPKVPRASVAGLAAPLIQSLVALLPALSSETAETVLDCLMVALELSPEATAHTEPLVASALLTLWTKHVADGSLTAVIVDSFCTIASVKEATAALAGHLIPILTQNFKHTEAIPGVTEGSLQILAALANNAQPALVPALLANAFMPVVDLMMRLDDHGVILTGCQTLKAFVRAGGAALATEKPDGTNPAAHLIIRVVVRVLSSFNDESAVEVGPLITRIVRTLGPAMGDTLSFLLSAALDRLAKSKLSFMQQSLVLLFAHLIIGNPTAVVSFLSTNTLSLPGPNGAAPVSVSALNFLLTLWTREQENFEGSFAIKVSLMALMKLLQVPDPVIQSAQVPGKVVVMLQERASRKARKPVENVQLMPLGQKVLQLLVQEYDTMRTQQKGDIDDELEDDDSDEGEYADHEIDPSLLTEGFAPAEDYEDFLTELMNDAAAGLEETDPDVLEDPLYAVDLQKEIETFVKTLANVNLGVLQQYAATLTLEERQVLEEIVKAQ